MVRDAARWAGRFTDVRRYEDVDSTNRIASSLAREGAPDGVVVVADHQSAGRGRLGRRWVAPPGTSLLVSVVLRPTLAFRSAALATIALGLAASDACDQVAAVRPLLKWPNDLVVDDAKLGGILGEVVLESAELAVVVGLGLNVNWTEAPPAGGVALNQVAGHPLDREALLAAVLDHLERRAACLDRAEETSQLLADYRERSATIGRRVRVELSSTTVAGRAVDVTPEGHLVIEEAGRQSVVAAGDVVHLRPG